MIEFKDYTPTQAVEEIESITGIKVGKNRLHSILRMKGIIDYHYNVLDKEQDGKYFYFQTVPVSKYTHSILSNSCKLFITEEGLSYLISHIKEWMEEYNKCPKKPRKEKYKSNYYLEGLLEEYYY